MRTLLIPRHTRFFPDDKIREKSASINKKYPRDLFDNYEDWFFFIHIDPVQRFIHAFGMYVGLLFFALMFVYWGTISWLYYILGVFFFYGLGLISHLIYDKGTAKSEPKFFLQTLYPVIRFNILTVLCCYDKALREFLVKYPFTVEAFDLVEVPNNRLFSFLFRRRPMHDEGVKVYE